MTTIGLDVFFPLSDVVIVSVVVDRVNVFDKFCVAIFAYSRKKNAINNRI